MGQLTIPGVDSGWESVTGHWHIGSNMVGYMPEGDALCAETLQQAVEFFGTELQGAQDECADECSDAGLECACEWCKQGREMDKLQEQIESGELQARVKANGGYGYIYTPPEGADISYWINPVGRTRQDEAEGKFSDKRTCEVWQAQNDIFPPSHWKMRDAWWGPGHWILHHAEGTVGRASINTDGSWDAFVGWLPRAHGKAVAECLRTIEEAFTVLYVQSEMDKRGL